MVWNARTWMVAALVAVFASGTAGASLIQDTTGGAVTYQHDGGGHSDAADTCQGLLAAHAFVPTNETQDFSGILIYGDDEADYYGANITTSLLGSRIRVELASEHIEVGLTVYHPDCGFSVTSEEGQNQTQAEAEANRRADHPIPVPGDGQKLVHVENPDSYDCNADEWKFLVNQVKGTEAPATIQVSWTNGDIQDLELTRKSNGLVAQYYSTSNLEWTLEDAVIVLSEGWNGSFQVAHGPCDAVEGDYGLPPPNTGANTFVEYTATSTQIYPILVTLGSPSAPDLTGQKSCHDLCADGLEAVSQLFYVLGMEAFAPGEQQSS